MVNVSKWRKGATKFRNVRMNLMNEIAKYSFFSMTRTKKPPQLSEQERKSKKTNSSQ